MARELRCRIGLTVQSAPLYDVTSAVYLQSPWNLQLASKPRLPVRSSMKSSSKRGLGSPEQRFPMKTIIGSALIGTGLAAAALSLAIPAHAESAAITIGQLEAQGFDVKLDRVGSAPLNQCEVTDVRNPRERTELVRVGGRGDRDFVPVVVKRTITVSLDCSR